MGRSGTLWLANVLNHVQNVDALHEYIGNREFWLLSWYLPCNVYAMPYLQRAKKSIEKGFTKEFFIDVNGYLQNSVPELKKVFEQEMAFHLVRDGRAVIRSLYSRRSDNNIHLIPKNRGEVEQWIDGNKFSQICWNWASTTLKLISENIELIQFEKLTSDYGYFEEKLLRPFNFNFSRLLWKGLVSKKVNKTRSTIHRFFYAKIKMKDFVKDELPPYEKWTDSQKKTFKEICGEAMKRAGYDF